MLLSFLLVVAAARAGRQSGTLDVIWVDSMGGGSTLIVTPAGESVLIDTGNPGGRDPGRIVAAARAEGLTRIDHVLITHFHTDHFGGAAEVAQQIPIGTLHDKGIPDHDPDGAEHSPFLTMIKPYRELSAEKREPLAAGVLIALKQAPGTPAIELRCLGANQKFVEPTAAQKAHPNPLTGSVPERPVDTSDNANSAVFLLRFGPFRFFDGGDLTWNTEAKLVTPYDLVGRVDVLQVEHHGLDLSNNPLLLRTAAPTVAVMGNGPRKGGEPGTFATLRALPSLQALYQLHRNVRVGPEGNTAPEYIANSDDPKPPEKGTGNVVRMSVAPDALHYTISIPATNFSRTYATNAGLGSH